MRCEEGGYSNLVQKKVLSDNDLTDRDRSFYTALFLGTLSRRITLDAMLSPFLKKGIESLDPEVRNILRCGVYQIFWMDKVPTRAAISESVDLCRIFRKSSAAGMVNAVLRKVSGSDRNAILGISDEVERLSLMYSVHPVLVRKLLEEYGEKTEEILSSTFLPDPIYVRINTKKTSVKELLSHAGERFSETDLKNCLKLNGGIRLIEDHLNKGEVYVEGYPAQWAAAILDVHEGQRVLDLCSAPGGKTMCLAMATGDKGSVTAVELHANRSKLVKELADRLCIANIDVVCADGTVFQEEEGFERVLCDVPCSGYGELSSKPELRYKDPNGAGSLTELQQRLLENGASLMKKGGKLVYSTCTILKEENEDIVRKFLLTHEDFEGCPIDLEGIPAEKISEHERKFLPCPELPEGFYVASLRKV